MGTNGVLFEMWESGEKSKGNRVENTWETDVMMSYAVLVGVHISISVLGSTPIGQFGCHS